MHGLGAQAAVVALLQARLALPPPQLLPLALTLAILLPLRSTRRRPRPSSQPARPHRAPALYHPSLSASRILSMMLLGPHVAPLSCLWETTASPVSKKMFNSEKHMPIFHN